MFWGAGRGIYWRPGVLSDVALSRSVSASGRVRGGFGILQWGSASAGEGLSAENANRRSEWPEVHTQTRITALPAASGPQSYSGQTAAGPSKFSVLSNLPPKDGATHER